MKRKCECCKRELKNSFSNQRFCISCSIYLKELKSQLAYYKLKVKTLKKELYGTTDGRFKI